MAFTEEFRLKQDIIIEYEQKRNKLLELVQNNKISEEEFLRRQEALRLDRDKKLKELEVKERAKKEETQDSTVNKPTEKPITQLPSTVTKEQFDQLSEEDKKKYESSNSTNTSSFNDCMSALNKLGPVVSALGPFSSAMGPIQQLTSLISPIQSAAESLKTGIETANEFSLKILDVEIAKPIIETVLNPLKSLGQLVTGGLAFYSQGPSAYSNIKQELQNFSQMQEKLDKYMEEARKLPEKLSKLKSDDQKNKEKATEEAKKDKSKNWTKTISRTRSSSSTIVISDETYKKLSPEEQKTYHEQTTSEKIQEAVKKVEIPSEVLSTLESSITMIEPINNLYTTAKGLQQTATTFIGTVDNVTQAVKIATMILSGSGMPTMEEMTQGVIDSTISNNQGNLNQLAQIQGAINKLSSFEPQYNMKGKQ